MKTLYCITSSSPHVTNNPNYILLKQACAEKGVEFVQLIAPQALVYKDVPNLDEGGMYILNTLDSCSQYGYALMKKNPHLKTVYESTPSLYTGWHELIDDESAGVPVIPAIYTPSEVVDEKLLGQIDDVLGGFPVILKRSGGSHGTGIIMIDSAISLKTALPHIIQGHSANFVLKKFISEAQNYRVIVLDGQVIGTMLYLPQAGDIRTNAVKTPTFERAEITDEWRDIAVQATRQKGVSFGGVDLLVDLDGKAFVAEVNTPCNFSRCQLLTGDTIAAQIVSYLC